MADSIKSKLPFVKEGTLAANEEVFLEVKDDEVHGLQAPGSTGYVKNDGPGEITVQSTDNSDGMSDVSTVKAGEQLIYEKEDDVEICTVHITADASGASYRARFARSSK